MIALLLAALLAPSADLVPRCARSIERAQRQLSAADRRWQEGSATLATNDTTVALRISSPKGVSYRASVSTRFEIIDTVLSDRWFDPRPVRSAQADLSVWRHHAGLEAHLTAPGPLGEGMGADWDREMRAALDECMGSRR